jgi:UDP-GlcNAc:undecaprenyl-phosphate GlcNAc-1-phosphate transferase
MGMNQKQAVAILYIVSAILGISAVVLTTSGELKAMVLMMTLLVVGALGYRVRVAKKRTADPFEQAKQAPPDPASSETAKD